MKIARFFAVAAVVTMAFHVGLRGECDAAPSSVPGSSTPAVSPATAAAIAALDPKDRKEMQTEQNMGAQVAASIEKEGKLSKDPALLDRVNRIGQKLAAIANTVQIPANFGNNKVYPFTWTFHVVDDNDVNAFSLPGGYVYVNAGLLKLIGTDDELAAVLGHEITHAAHHHIATMAHEANKMNTDMLIGVLAAVLAHAPGGDIGNVTEGAMLTQEAIMNNHFSENAERDADHGGLIYMTKAGYNPIGMLSFMEKLKELEHRSPDLEMGIFMDHPYTDERLENIRAQLASMGITPTAAQMYEMAAKPDRFNAVPGTGKMRQIQFKDTVCAVIYDPDGSRIADLLKPLNAAFGRGMEISDIAAVQDTVLLDNDPWLKVQPQDVSSGTTADDMAKQIAHSLQMVIYRQSFLSLDTSPSNGLTESVPSMPAGHQ